MLDVIVTAGYFVHWVLYQVWDRKPHASSPCSTVLCISSCQEIFLALLLSMFYQHGRDDREKKMAATFKCEKTTRYCTHHLSLSNKEFELVGNSQVTSLLCLELCIILLKYNNIIIHSNSPASPQACLDSIPCKDRWYNAKHRERMCWCFQKK